MMLTVPELPLLLHIPDGFLSAPIALLTYAASALVLAYAVRQTNRTLEDRTVPLMGVLAAFIFAAQMMNFPVAGGSSGHLIGGALAAILLGPWAGMLVMTAVLGVQSLIFQDGGLSALGANVLNMAILGVLVGCAVFRLPVMACGPRRGVVLFAAFAAGWASMMVGAFAVAVQLALSGTSPWGVVVVAMLGIHALLGFIDGLITAGAIGFIMATRADLLSLPRDVMTPASGRKELVR